MRLGSKAKLTIGVGLVAACSFAILGIRELSRVPKPVQAMANPLPQKPSAPQAVLAATTRAINTGETITADMIRSAPGNPAQYPDAATPAEIVGKVATRDIPANTLIPRAALTQETKLAIRVPRGMRAISIDTNSEIAVAGLVRPGDLVDVQVVYPGADAINGARGTGRSQATTLLQMVKVLAVGETVVGTQPATGMTGQPAPPPPQPARTVTLALNPEQISTLSLAKSTGALYLSLRNPDDDAQVAVARAVSAGPIPLPPRAPAPMVATAPVMPAAMQAPPRPRQESHAIELVVGGKQDVIYSGSGSR